MTTSLTRAAGLCALLATTCLVSPALAQSADQPSIYKNVDDNGVDLTDGSFNFSLIEGSIGSGEGTIALMRSLGTGGERDNLSVRFNRTAASGVATISLTFGNIREDFSGPEAATSFTSAQGSGATLAKVSASEYRYVDANGVATVYGPPPGLTDASNNGYCSSGNESPCGLIAIQTSAPNGAVTSYQWDVGENCTTSYDKYGEPIESCAQFWRQRGVSNNFGYSLMFKFQQEANPTTGLPNAAWHKRIGATLTNNAVPSSPRTVSYAFPDRRRE